MESSFQPLEQKYGKGNGDAHVDLATNSQASKRLAPVLDYGVFTAALSFL